MLILIYAIYLTVRNEPYPLLLTAQAKQSSGKQAFSREQWFRLSGIVYIAAYALDFFEIAAKAADFVMIISGILFVVGIIARMYRPVL